MPIIYDDAPLDERVHENLSKDFQHRAIESAQDAIDGKRQALVDEDPHWTEKRFAAAKVRSQVLNNLDYYVRQFATNAQNNGCEVHFARTDEEAADIVERIMVEAEQDTLIKAKSLLSEEVGVNQRLEARGMKAIETDCAEVILQDAGSPPSHIVVPALHFDRTSIRDIFAKTRGYEGSDDPEEITHFLRQNLRPQFLSAHVGMTGCNFGVASTGTMTLVTNEGNGRMACSFPETLIVMVGIDRLVPDLASLDVLMQLLVPSAVGSKITSSFTLNTRPAGAQEGDGPRTIHVVMVDNGRSSILGSSYRQAMRCIHCGACMNICPVYRHITGHGYGSIYPGPMGLVLTPLLVGYDKIGKLLNACSLCSACASVCPVKIPLNSYILNHRNDMVTEGHSSRAERIVFGAVSHFFGSRKLYGVLTSAGTPVMKLMAGRKGYLGEDFGVPVAKNWTASRDMTTLKKTFRKQFAEHTPVAAEIHPQPREGVEAAGGEEEV